MSLFTDEDLYSKHITGVVDSNAKNEFVMAGKEDFILTTFGKLRENTTFHFVSGGMWSLADIVYYILKQIGPAHLVACTWSFTGPAAAKLIYLQDIGLIKSMSFLIDNAMSKWSKGAFATIRPHCKDISTTLIHAKGFVIYNDGWEVSCTTSMNFSNNPRIESGVISTNHEVFEFSKKWIERGIKQGNKFEIKSNHLAEEIKLDKEHISTGKIVYIIRGVRGAGKSTLAKSIADVVCENDEFFVNDGYYFFNPVKTNLAVSYCKATFKQAIEDGKLKIAVANTFKKECETKYYKEFAQKHGYAVFQIICQNVNDTKNIHGVDDETVRVQKKKFEVKL